MAYCCTPHSGPDLKRNKNAYFAHERPKGASNKNPIVFNELQKFDFSLAQKQTRFHLGPTNRFALQELKSFFCALEFVCNFKNT